MKRLLDIINNRPVIIICHGPSVSALECRIQEFADYDVCWTSINHARLVEENILAKIDKTLEVIYCSAPIRALQNLNYLKSYLDRQEGNVWVTSPDVYQQVRHNPDKTLVDYSPSHGVFNTLLSYIVLLMRLRVGKIVLFGADGGSSDGDIYYREGEFELHESEYDRDKKRKQMDSETMVINKMYDQFLSYYNIPRHTVVVNCSEGSKIEVFDKANYHEVHNILRR